MFSVVLTFVKCSFLNCVQFLCFIKNVFGCNSHDFRTKETYYALFPWPTPGAPLCLIDPWSINFYSHLTNCDINPIGFRFHCLLVICLLGIYRSIRNYFKKIERVSTSFLRAKLIIFLIDKTSCLILTSYSKDCYCTYDMALIFSILAL
jgi:hypothetical protein